MKKIYTIVIFYLVIYLPVIAQEKGIGIGTPSVHESAVLHIHSADGDQGVLMPVLDGSQRATIQSVAEDGLIVYDKDEHVHYQFHEGADQWQAIVPVPKGGIIMWSGDPTTIPPGWVLCNGSNGTPDLRGRFIVGYSASDGDYNDPGAYSHGDGAEGGDAADRGGVRDIDLEVRHLPSHSHSMSSAGNHNHSFSTNTAGSHQHDLVEGKKYSTRVNNVDGPGIVWTAGVDSFSGSGQARGNNNYETQRLRNHTYSSGSHSHTGSTNSMGGHNHSISSTGSGVDYENRPPYYTLAFIMKTL